MRKKKKQPNIQRKPRQAPDETVSVPCSQCRHPHAYASLAALDTMSIFTPCEECGHLFLLEIRQKTDAIRSVLDADPQAAELLRQDNFEAFYQLVEQRTGVKLKFPD
jgi:transcription elongation factor Elf1